ncbi:MAG: hypothetical protein NTZ44_03125 [Candidatus Nomurabacteria bacterium]|nr:hypothetical protein [Candidatus Nomurabacteria bacterium]
MKKIIFLITTFMAFVVIPFTVFSQDSIKINTENKNIEKIDGDYVVNNFVLPSIAENVVNSYFLRKALFVWKQNNEQKEWLDYILSDSAYFYRLNFENDDNKENTIDEIWRRRNELSYKYVVEPIEKIKNYIPGATGYYDTVVHLPDIDYLGETGALHEFVHQITNGGKYITPYAKKLYKLAFDSSKVGNNILCQEKIFKNSKGEFLKYSAVTEREYYGNPIEMDAFNKQFRFLFWTLTGKNYSEEFTECDYEKAMELLKEGSFNQSKNVVMFLKSIKHEYFCLIMNTIA